MNGGRNYGSPIPDQQLSDLMGSIYNGWFLKWKRRAARMSDDEFDEAASEMSAILEQGEQYPVVRHLCISLLYELEARMHGGYTKTGRDKLLAIIQRETE